VITNAAEEGVLAIEFRKVRGDTDFYYKRVSDIKKFLSKLQVSEDKRLKRGPRMKMDQNRKSRRKRKRLGVKKLSMEKRMLKRPRRKRSKKSRTQPQLSQWKR